MLLIVEDEQTRYGNFELKEKEQEPEIKENSDKNNTDDLESMQEVRF